MFSSDSGREQRRRSSAAGTAHAFRHEIENKPRSRAPSLLLSLKSTTATYSFLHRGTVALPSHRASIPVKANVTAPIGSGAAGAMTPVFKSGTVGAWRLGFQARTNAAQGLPMPRMRLPRGD